MDRRFCPVIRDRSLNRKITIVRYGMQTTKTS
jgi:hypothetical protein